MKFYENKMFFIRKSFVLWVYIYYNDKGVFILVNCIDVIRLILLVKKWEVVICLDVLLWMSVMEIFVELCLFFKIGEGGNKMVK